jgi:glycosyltransferase involved in cell wall biosynthesis
MATITIDARMIVTGGIGTYLQSLIGDLGNSRSPHRFFALVPKFESHKSINFGSVSTIPVRTAVYSPAEHWAIPFATPGGSVLHVPHYNVPAVFRGPVVTNIHDLIHLDFPGFFRSAAKAWYSKFLLLHAMRKSRVIITGSNATKESLIRHGGPESKIHVIPYRLSRSLMEAPGDDDAMRRNGLLAGSYFLFVGRLQVHKNFDGLLDAFVEFCRADTDVRLVAVVYKFDKRFDVQNMIERRGLGGRVTVLSDVSFGFLKSLYKGAIAVILPSFIEGFGLPVLEAMALGTPVIASKIPPVIEVAGNAALVVDPRRPAEISDAMKQLQRSSPERTRMIEAGIHRAQAFASVQIGRETEKVYELALA